MFFFIFSRCFHISFAFMNISFSSSPFHLISPFLICLSPSFSPFLSFISSSFPCVLFPFTNYTLPCLSLFPITHSTSSPCQSLLLRTSPPCMHSFPSFHQLHLLSLPSLPFPLNLPRNHTSPAKRVILVRVLFPANVLNW